ncbi:hypothetical protein I302_105986 [Kwoniella bestiolae CBS 10118]|uniref:Myb-like domain-containing protein n=1 Tax=Kwoniella bestiolae CBS 10118 TaxID=1296100 RepID=A0A1B9G2Q0_9TREE|nr:hypothetical protein I302_05110 [Kwoniella bestiolae CBS 10118]OCF25296.1 hypothetical protein I302_05110 [Kwoniella bestiolae CBS 10118]
MPVKRDNSSTSDSENELKPLIKTPTKKRKKSPSTSPRKERKAWTEIAATQFKEAINNIVKKNIWAEVKNHFPGLAGNRSADVCINHWGAIFDPLQCVFIFFR